MTLFQRLPRMSPESQGISSSAILNYLESVKLAGQELHSFMLLRNGFVFAEAWWLPYGPANPHMLYSLSKSFTSSAAGMAVSEGLLTLDDSVLKFFPDEIPAEVSPNLASMKIRHLLSMSTGHDQDTTGNSCSSPDGNWARGFLSLPVDHVPGKHFVYNSAATYMVSAIVEKVTGMGLLEYLQPKLLSPLGIVGAKWDTCPRGIAMGGWGLNICTEDIACFGQLYLQKGMWNDARILSEAWVAEATSKQVENGTDPNSDWAQGYGYQFWRSCHNGYRGDGAFGQYCIVLPDFDMVIAITSGLGDMQAPLNTIWTHLLPAIGSEPLPEDSASNEMLKLRTTGLQVQVPKSDSLSPVVLLSPGSSYRFSANEFKIKTIAFSHADDEIDISIEDEEGVHTLAVGVGKWISGSTSFLLSRVLRISEVNSSWRTSAYAEWISATTLQIKLCFYETPFTPTLTFHFSEHTLKLDIRGSIGFGPAEWPTLEAYIN